MVHFVRQIVEDAAFDDDDDDVLDVVRDALDAQSLELNLKRAGMEVYKDEPGRKIWLKELPIVPSMSMEVPIPVEPYAITRQYDVLRVSVWALSGVPYQPVTDESYYLLKVHARFGRYVDGEFKYAKGYTMRYTASPSHPENREKAIAEVLQAIKWAENVAGSGTLKKACSRLRSRGFSSVK